jgi:creatinine amidohydrolase
MSAPQPRYERLTWPEADEAARSGRICVVPVGAVEQHGPHLPLDVDTRVVSAVAAEAVASIPELATVLPCVAYGYTAHVMDFPGTINIEHTHFMAYVLDICRSLAHHGFAKILLLNGHGSNQPNLDLVARRANLETSAEVAQGGWWSLLTVDPGFLENWRESEYPGGCAHACELETSVYMHLWPEDMRSDLVVAEDAAFNAERSRYRYTDAFGSGPVSVTSWTSSYTDSGVVGRADLATAEKGKLAFQESVKRLKEFLVEWSQAPVRVRHDRHGSWRSQGGVTE